MGLATVRLLALLAAAASRGGVEPQQPQSPPAVAPGQAEPAADDVVVVTASRREEQLRNAPATMTVVSEATIAQAPAQTVTDLLRHVPGINVSQTSARDFNVTPRAATGTLSDSTLVLLDGRSIYQDFFGSVLWDFLPVDVNEIKQIEVIRGPASAVWGANAMNGVINVISKTPREMQGSRVDIRLGQFDRTAPGESYDGGGLFAVNVSHAAVTGDRFAYKVSAGFLTQEPFLRPTGAIPGGSTTYPAYQNRGTTQPRLDGRVDYDFADSQGSLVVAGGIAATEGMLHSGLGPLDIQRGSTFKYGRLAYTRGGLKFQTFVNALDGETLAALLKNEHGEVFASSFEDQAYDVEISDVHLLGSKHVVSYGGNYRYNNFDLSIAPRGTHRQEGGAYVQDEIVFSDTYRWIVGLRVDGFDVLRKAVFSPRTTLLIKPRPEHTLRLSYNRAFRAPSFVNSYLDTHFLLDVDLGAAGIVAVPVEAVGNSMLNEEALTAYEAAYSGTVGRIATSAAVYVNRVRDAIQFTQTGTYTLSYLNFAGITDWGVELAGNLPLTPSASLFANYSWQDRPRATGVDPSELNVPPRHRINAGVNAARGRYFGSVWGSFVDSAYWQDVMPQHTGTTDAYTLIDGAVGVHATDGQMTVIVRGTNLLNTRVQQHVFGDVIRRAVTGEIRLRF